MCNNVGYCFTCKNYKRVELGSGDKTVTLKHINCNSKYAHLLICMYWVLVCRETLWASDGITWGPKDIVRIACVRRRNTNSKLNAVCFHRSATSSLPIRTQIGPSVGFCNSKTYQTYIWIDIVSKIIAATFEYHGFMVPKV